MIGVTAGGLGAVPLPEPGFVRLRAVDQQQLGVVAELNGPATATGYGTHEIVARDGRLGLTKYAGREPLSVRLPLLLDRWRERGSVEAEIAVLEQMLGLDPALPAPPQLIVEGLGVPHSYSRDPGLRWVLSGDPEWGEDLRYRDQDGHLSYAEIAVTARQDVKPVALEAPTSTSRAYFTVAKGSELHTLRRIAKHRKVDWQKLRALNPSLPGDPDKTLKAGTKVRVS